MIFQNKMLLSGAAFLLLLDMALAMNDGQPPSLENKPRRKKKIPPPPPAPEQPALKKRKNGKIIPPPPATPAPGAPAKAPPTHQGRVQVPRDSLPTKTKKTREQKMMAAQFVAALRNKGKLHGLKKPEQSIDTTAMESHNNDLVKALTSSRSARTPPASSCNVKPKLGYKRKKESDGEYKPYLYFETHSDKRKKQNWHFDSYSKKLADVDAQRLAGTTVPDLKVLGPPASEHDVFYYHGPTDGRDYSKTTAQMKVILHKINATISWLSGKKELETRYKKAHKHWKKGNYKRFQESVGKTLGKIKGFAAKAMEAGTEDGGKLMALDAFLMKALNYEKLVETLKRTNDSFTQKELVEADIKRIFNGLYKSHEL